MGQPPLDTSRPDLSRPAGQELQPVEPWKPSPRPLGHTWDPDSASWKPDSWWAERFAHATHRYPEPCSPPASQPAAEPAEPSAPSREGSGSAGGAGTAPLPAVYRLRRLIEDRAIRSGAGIRWIGSGYILNRADISFEFEGRVFQVIVKESEGG